MSDVTLSYKGSDILELSDSGSATLKTGGKYCEDDIAVEYVKPSGGGGDYTIDDIFTADYPYGDITVNADFGNLAAAFYGRTNVTGITAPNTMRIHDMAFTNCTRLAYIHAPNAWQISANAFQNCSKLRYAVFPSLRVLYSSAFLVCSSLEAADFGGTPTSSEGFIRANLFQGATKMKTLILRTSDIVFPLSNINTFNGSPFTSGGTGGTLYVPQDLISSYQSATNWSTILGYANNQILKIEGSYYETHYADGTEITS